MTTNDIDKIVHDFIIKHNAYPTPIGFMGFPNSVCTSVNEGILYSWMLYYNEFKIKFGQSFAMEFQMKDL